MNVIYLMNPNILYHLKLNVFDINNGQVDYDLHWLIIQTEVVPVHENMAFFLVVDDEIVVIKNNKLNILLYFNWKINFFTWWWKTTNNT
jgi:hypothetical protein